jgi:hypothetical protein
MFSLLLNFSILYSHLIFHEIFLRKRQRKETKEETISFTAAPRINNLGSSQNGLNILKNDLSILFKLV